MAQSCTEFSFSSQRLTLSAIRWGAVDAPALLLVHGGRDQQRSWDALAQHLADQYQVIAFDLRGHGQSDWVTDGEYSVMDHVFDLASLVEHLKLDTFTLIGHSLGGNIALRYAGLYPEKITKLVAIEGLGPSPKMLAEREAQPMVERLHNWVEQRRTLSDRKPRMMADIAEAEARMAAAFPHLPKELVHHLTKTGLRELEDGTVQWAYDPAGLGRSPSDITHADFVTLWTRISCPTWLVYGATSWASNPAEDGRAEHFQNAEVSVIESAGHWVHHDQFDVFLSELWTFLS